MLRREPLGFDATSIGLQLQLALLKCKIRAVDWAAKRAAAGVAASATVVRGLAEAPALNFLNGAF